MPAQNIAITSGACPEGVGRAGNQGARRAAYTLLNVLGSPTVPEGKYLQDPATGASTVQWIQGIGSENAAAPQARLMSVVINGILNQKLPWGLVLLGVFLVVAVELLGIRSLSFAVGSYLSIGTTAAIFCGGVVKWLAERGQKQTEEGEASPGALYASRPDRRRRDRGPDGHRASRCSRPRASCRRTRSSSGAACPSTPATWSA